MTIPVPESLGHLDEVSAARPVGGGGGGPIPFYIVFGGNLVQVATIMPAASHGDGTTATRRLHGANQPAIKLDYFVVDGMLVPVENGDKDAVITKLQVSTSPYNGSEQAYLLDYFALVNEA